MCCVDIQLLNISFWNNQMTSTDPEQAVKGSELETPQVILETTPNLNNFVPQIDFQSLQINRSLVSQDTSSLISIQPQTMNLQFNNFFKTPPNINFTLPPLKTNNTQIELQAPIINIEMQPLITSQSNSNNSKYDSQLNLDGFDDLLEETEPQTQQKIDEKLIQIEPLQRKSNSGDKNLNTQSIMKKTKSQMTSVVHKESQDAMFDLNIIHATLNHEKFMLLEQENKQLRQINGNIMRDVELLRSFIRLNFKSPELVGKTADIQTKLALDKCFLDKPLVVLAFASPLIRIKETNGIKESLEMDLLDYSKEFQCAISGLKKTNNAILVKQIHATLERFQHILTDNPVGLHFSGHGIQNNLQTLGQDHYYNYNQGNCLVFEQKDGIAHCVSQEKLKQIVSVSSLKFVFIATCHSQFAGEIFHNAGVDHVICVHQNVMILDEAAVIFSQNFYELLFKETLTVCEAFYQAKKMLETHPQPHIGNEASHFMILKKKQDGKKHECKILGPFPTGKVVDLTVKPQFPFSLSKIDEFVGRQIDMQQIISCVLQFRLTTLKGIPGIGKTTISKCLGIYISERELFEDGVIYISMRGHDQTSQLIQQLYSYFLNQLENPNRETNQNQAYMEDKIFSSLKNKKVLLIIDNLEEALRNDKIVIREFLKQMFERLPDLKILSTSRDLISDIGEITEKVYELSCLSKNYSIQLLEKKSLRIFEQQEIIELLESKIPRQFELAIAKPIRKGIQINRLEDHHLSDLLAGHPMTVSLVAPLLQSCTLSQLYQKMLRMMSSKNLIQNLHELNPIDSLKVSTDASIQHVRSVHPQAIDLFCLLGMLPGGVIESDLNKLWFGKENQKDWYHLIVILKKYSLLVEKVETQSELTKSKTKYMLSVPIMNIYAVSLLKPHELKQFQEIIVEFFISKYKTLYQDISVEHKRSKKDEQHKIRLILIEYEINIWACIYRICFEDHNDIESQKNLKKRRQHRHHMVGYSSADEYEQVLISEMTSDAGEEFLEDQTDKIKKQFDKQTSSSSKYRSVTNSEAAPSSNSHTSSPFRPEKIATLTNESNIKDKSMKDSINEFQEIQSNGTGDKASLGPILSVGEYRSNRSSFGKEGKKVRFLTNAGEDTINSISSDEKQSKLNGRYSEVIKNPQFTTSIIQEEYFSDSSIKSQDSNDSSARGSITQSNGGRRNSKLIETNSVLRTLQRNKTEGDLHFALSGSLDLVVEESNLTQNNINLSESSKKISEKEILNQDEDKFSDQTNFEYNENIQNNEIQETNEPRQLSEVLDKDFFEMSNQVPEETIYHSNNQNDQTNFQISKKSVEEPTILNHFTNSEIESTQIENTQNSNITDLQSNNKKRFGLSLTTQKQKNFRNQPSGTQLEPIQEKTDFLTKYGLLLVIFVSVQVLNRNYQDAERVIKMASTYCQQDAICRANLQKLQALIYLMEKNYEQSLTQFEIANQSFSIIHQKRLKVGLALCIAAEGYLLFNKTTYFITPKQDESQIFQKAKLKFSAALQIYKESNHVAGQAYCCKHLSSIKKKMGESDLNLNSEIRRLEKEKIKQMQEGLWIHRFDGDELSLFVEIIGEIPKNTNKSTAQASQIKIETWIPMNPLNQSRVQTSKIKGESSKSRIHQTKRKEINNLEKSKIQQLDNLSDDEDESVELEELKSKMSINKHGSIMKKQYNQNNSFAQNTENQKIQKAQYKEKDENQVKKKKANLISNPQATTQNSRTTSLASQLSSTEKYAGENRLSKRFETDQLNKDNKKVELNASYTTNPVQKASNFKQRNQFNYIQKEPLPENIQSLHQLDYRWGYHILRTDEQFNPAKHIKQPYIFYDLETCWNIENYYQKIVNQKITKSDKLIFKGDNGNIYYIQKDPNKKGLSVDMENSSLQQMNSISNYTRKIARFSQDKELNPNFNRQHQVSKKTSLDTVEEDISFECSANEESPFLVKQDQEELQKVEELDRQRKDSEDGSSDRTKSYNPNNQFLTQTSPITNDPIQKVRQTIGIGSQMQTTQQKQNAPYGEELQTSQIQQSRIPQLQNNRQKEVMQQQSPFQKEITSADKIQNNLVQYSEGRESMTNYEQKQSNNTRQIFEESKEINQQESNKLVNSESLRHQKLISSKKYANVQPKVNSFKNGISQATEIKSQNNQKQIVDNDALNSDNLSQQSSQTIQRRNSIIQKPTVKKEVQQKK